MEEKSTRQNLLDISRQLMMSKGYNATTVEEICKLANVTKGAFFYYFKSKEEIGIATLNAYWANRQHQFMSADWFEGAQPLQQIESFLGVVAEVFTHDPYGYACLAGSFTQELANTNPMFQGLVADLFGKWAEQIKPVLQAAKEATEATKEGAKDQTQIDVDLLADHIIVVIEGALILAQARQDPAVIAQQLNMLNAHLKQVFGA